MTTEELKIHLKKHYFLMFRYNSEYYSLKRSQSLFGARYSLTATDTLPYLRDSLEKLCEEAFLSDGTLLVEAIEHIDIPSPEDPSWKSFEAVRHSAIVYGSEIHFVYNGIGYWIAHTTDGLSHLTDDLGNTQVFPSCRILFEEAHIDGSILEDLWGRVLVDTC